MLTDRETLAALIEKIGVEPKEAEFDDKGHLIKLDLSDSNLVTLPPEIGQLTNLRELYLGNNQLSQLPPELWQLTNLQTLSLGKDSRSGNPLSQLSPEIGRLTNLRTLDFRGNQLDQLPQKSAN